MGPDDVLEQWEWPGPATVRPAESGLINDSWVVVVDDAPIAVLQRLNTDVFVPEVHEDIEAITARLAARDVPTPRLRPTRDGDLWHTADDGTVWRVLSRVGSTTVHTLRDPRRARSAGALVARVHAALAGFECEFRSVREGAHDTEAHLARLREAVLAHPEHRLHDEVAPLADRILARWERWEGPTDLPRRIIHGDLKISNVRFEGTEAVALIDLDTFQWGTLDAELGDAFRSWCNPGSEADPAARFDLRIFEAAIEGYAQHAEGVTETEWASIVPGIERIALELAARFARDALEERYFGWDEASWPARGEHCLARAQGQFGLARTVAHAAPHAERKLQRARQAPAGPPR